MDTWIWVVIIVAVVVVLFLVAWGAWSRRRRHSLHDRFGKEYDRTVEGADSRRKAEHELREREAEHEELELQPLSEESRRRYEEEWNGLQAGFVDRPRRAVADADDLLTEVMRERGYPVDNFEAKSRLVSVDHPDVVENYRKGHAVYLKTVDGKATTEELRQAVVSYRALFEDLVHEDSEPRS